MSERGMEGRPAALSRPGFVPVLLLLAVVVIVGIVLLAGQLGPEGLGQIIGDLFGDQAESTQVVEVVESIQASTQEPNEPQPTATPTPFKTQTNTPSVIPTAVFTATVPPRVLSEEEFKEFLVLGPGRMLLLSGWKFYDEVSVFDDYPCLVDILSCTNEEREQSVSNAYSQINDANFYCEWACQGFARYFGYWAPYPRERFWEGINASIGDPEKEPYCPQFSGSYEYFSCDQPVPRPTIIPLEDYNWTQEERDYVEREFLYPILYAGWERFLDWPHWHTNWTREDVDRLADSYVCWVVANGHWVYGWPQYKSNDGTEHYKLRLQLRKRLNQSLGKPRGDQQPLCPDFKDMIGDEYLP